MQEGCSGEVHRLGRKRVQGLLLVVDVLRPLLLLLRRYGIETISAIQATSATSHRANLVGREAACTPIVSPSVHGRQAKRVTVVAVIVARILAVLMNTVPVPEAQMRL